MTLLEPDDPPEEELPGQDGPPPRWHRPAAAVAVLAAVAAVVVLGVRAAGDDAPDAAATTSRPAPSSVPVRSLPPVPSAERTFALEVPGVQRVETAVAAAFGRRSTSIASFTTYPTDAAASTRRDYLFHVGRGLLSVRVGLRPAGARDYVGRTAHSIRIVQALQDRWVDLTVTSPGGPTTARDYAALQALVQDTRLLGR